MDNRFVQIVSLIYQSQVIQLDELSKKMSFSDKTIRKIISDHQDITDQYGFKIIHIFKKGYHIEISDEELFHTFITHSSDKTIIDNEQRINYIIARLISNDDYLKIEDMAEDMFLSRSSIDRLIPKIKEELKSYDLDLQSKAKYGIKVTGSEKQKRLCFAHVNNNDLFDVDKDLSMRVQKIILSCIEESDIVIADNNIYNLLQHCIIMIKRIKKGNVLPEESNLQYGDKYKNEINCARKIAEELEESFSVKIPQVETDYIAMHLLGKQILLDKNAVSLEVFEYVDEILQEIYDNKKIDLRNDADLKTQLIFHIQPLILRMKFGLKQKNPILNEVKKEMNQGYEFAIYASDVIYRSTGLFMDDDEKSFLALHFTLALEKLEKHTKSYKKICVVCGTGRGTAKLLQYRLTNKLNFKADDLILVSAISLEKMNFDDVLCILSTIPLANKYPVPVLIIDLSISDTTKDKIEKLINDNIPTKQDSLPYLVIENLNGKDKEDVIRQMVNICSKQFGLDSDFYEQVIKRESLSSTEQSNMIAMPHPYVVSDDCFVLCFAKLEKPIIWKYDYVSVVILVNYPNDCTKNEEILIDTVTRVVSDDTCVKQLTNNFSKETIDKLLYGER